jgi:hypothetical protein
MPASLIDHPARRSLEFRHSASLCGVRLGELNGIGQKTGYSAKWRDRPPGFNYRLYWLMGPCVHVYKMLQVFLDQCSESPGLRSSISTHSSCLKMWVSRAMSIGLLAISTLCQTLLAAPSPFGGRSARTPAEIIIPRDDNGLQDVVWFANACLGVD